MLEALLEEAGPTSYPAGGNINWSPFWRKYGSTRQKPQKPQENVE